MVAPPTSSGTGPPNAPKDQSGARDDRYKAGAREQVTNAYLGTSSVDMLRDATGGREDIPKKIKLAIRRQYFTTDQAFGIVAAALMFGIGLNTLIYIGIGTIDFRLVGGTMNKLAFLMLGVSLGAILGSRQTRGGLKCDPKSKQVKRGGKAGQPCLDQNDCTNEKEVEPDICTHPAKQGNSGAFRKFIYYGAPLAMFTCFAWSAATSEDQVTGEERYIMASIGLMIGVSIMFIVA